MPFHPDWGDIALRLFLTAVTGAIIGFDRGEHSRPAGLRTTLLVCLAASVSMVLTNQLLNMTGKTADSFAVADVLRLPLGILSGMGFIGAAAVVRRGDLVLGVTTAATLWFVTVMGLCFGGGAIRLGLVTFALGFLTIWGLKFLEKRMITHHRATLTVETENGGPTQTDIQNLMREAGFRTEILSTKYHDHGRICLIRYVIRWHARLGKKEAPAVIDALARRDGVVMVSWSV
ncbi:MAG TPA: MgtC/SapB family protein [Magnetospirillaceae bacterium]|jgi:putative Mg2+ transporter-C (MgtC) family protein